MINIGTEGNAIIGAFVGSFISLHMAAWGDLAPIVGMRSSAIDGMALATLFSFCPWSKNGLSCNRNRDQFDGPSDWFIYCIPVSWVKPAKPSGPSPFTLFSIPVLADNPMAGRVFPV